MDEVNEAIRRCNDCRPELIGRRGRFSDRAERELRKYRGWPLNDEFWARWTGELIVLWMGEGICGKHAAIYAAHSVMVARSNPRTELPNAFV